MAVITPGRRPAYPPIGRLRTSPLSGGKKSGFVSLNLTAMVDMFTILVIFLIQLFTASGQVTMNDRVKVPTSVAGAPLEDPGTVVMMNNEGLLLVDNQPIAEEEMGTELDIPIPGMVTLLTKQREFREKIEGRDPTQPYSGYLIIQADIKTDFRMIRRVLTSANLAGWAKIKFVTIPGKTDAAGDEFTQGDAAVPAAE
jgi:biopolymer transport protein ExbD